MNIRLILAVSTLALSMPIMASANTISVGTSNSTGNTNICGTLSTSSWSSSVDQNNSLSLSGSAQIVESVALDSNKNSLGGAVTLQGDASLDESTDHSVTKSGTSTNFHGSESETTVTNSSSAFVDFAP